MFDSLSSLIVIIPILGYIFMGGFNEVQCECLDEIKEFIQTSVTVEEFEKGVINKIFKNDPRQFLICYVNTKIKPNINTLITFDGITVEKIKKNYETVFYNFYHQYAFYLASEVLVNEILDPSQFCKLLYTKVPEVYQDNIHARSLNENGLFLDIITGEAFTEKQKNIELKQETNSKKLIKSRNTCIEHLRTFGYNDQISKITIFKQIFFSNLYDSNYFDVKNYVAHVRDVVKINPSAFKPMEYCLNFGNFKDLIINMWDHFIIGLKLPLKFPLSSVIDNRLSSELGTPYSENIDFGDSSFTNNDLSDFLD